MNKPAGVPTPVIKSIAEFCRRRSVFSGLAVVALLPCRSFAQSGAGTGADALAAELKKLQSKAEKFDSFRVKFEQQVFSALRRKTTSSQGTLAFTQPRKFRWEIDSPKKEVYVNNGQWFWKYVESTKHAVRLPADSGDLEFLDVIFALDKIQNKYKLQKILRTTGIDGKAAKDCPQNHTCISLEPLQSGQQKNIELAVDQSNGFVSMVRIDFRNGNRTMINFSGIKQGKISVDTFEFNPPPGTAVDKK
ncbi:MAG: outer rane lipoprotein chaperone LolA [Pseudomonadota bacterium]|jgi:outer membrane lipoprotein carrier protein